MNIRNKVIDHYKKFFDLHAKGIALDEDDYLNIDWATALIEELTKAEKLPIHDISGSALATCDNCGSFVFTADGKQCVECKHYR